MRKFMFVFFLGTWLVSCSKGIVNSKVCPINQNFDALKGCSENYDSFEEAPETVIYSFLAKSVLLDSKVTMHWYFEEAGNYTLIDSFSYYTKRDKELIVSGIDRNFLQPGAYVIKTTLKNTEQTFEEEKRFQINLGSKPQIYLLLVGSATNPSGLVTRPQTYYDSSSPKIFVSSYIYNAKPNSEIKIHFKHAEKGKFNKTFSTKTGANPKSKFLLYAYLPNVNLPLGEYRVEIDLGTDVFKAPFFIDATQEIKPL